MVRTLCACVVADAPAAQPVAPAAAGAGVACSSAYFRQMATACFRI
jgi:hypothetical protein